MKASSEKGQVLAAVLILLMVVSTLVPVMVLYSQREAFWTVKQARSTTAFHLAEAGIEKGYLTLSLSTGNWKTITDGGTLPGFNFDSTFSDLSGGTYKISITSGPLDQQATIVSVGRDSLAREVRAIRAVYANATLGNVAIMGGSGVDISGNNMKVEWGAIISPKAITANDELHPSFWSADNIVGLDTNGSTPPNCDSPNCWWWHSYYSGIPPMPTIDFTFYRSSAQNSGNAACGPYYVNGSRSVACTSTNGKPFFIEGNWTNFNGPIVGSVIVMGNLSTPNGSLSGQSVAAPVPRQAWKQYCNDWDFYIDEYDPTCPHTTQCPGIYHSYLSPANLTYTISPVVRGLLYVGGDFTGPNGGGNSVMAYGVLVVKGNVYLNSNSHVKIYYDSATSQALQTTKFLLARQSWKDELRDWPGP